MKIQKLLLLPALSLFLITSLYSQGELARNISHETTSPALAPVKEMAMTPPSFTGGHDALALYMRENLNYPAYEKLHDIEGTVILEYYINPDGRIESIKVVESVSQGLDAEAVRLTENMPHWNPAIIQGVQRRVKYRLPITFDLTF